MGDQNQLTRILKPEVFFLFCFVLFCFWQIAKYPTLVPTKASASVSFDSLSAHLSDFGVSGLPCDHDSLTDLRKFDH